MLRLGTHKEHLFYITVFSGGDLLLNCKLLPNNRATSSATPNVDSGLPPRGEGGGYSLYSDDRDDRHIF